MAGISYDTGRAVRSEASALFQFGVSRDNRGDMETALFCVTRPPLLQYDVRDHNKRDGYKHHRRAQRKTKVLEPHKGHR